MTASIYIRVSTRDKGQDPENQLRQIETLIEHRGWKRGIVYEDRETASGERRRPAFERMMSDARRGRIKLLVFWSLDRFSREGVRKTLEYLHQLDEWGVRFLSVQEQYLDTLGPFREAVIGILAAVAQMERKRLGERVRAAMDRKRSRGERIGGVPKKIDEDKLTELRRAGRSLREIARELQIGKATVVRRCKKLGI